MISYFQTTPHLLLYRVTPLWCKLAPLPPLKHVTTLTLLQCDPTAVGMLLRPEVFPSLGRVEYLSAAPTARDLHRRFTRTRWVFPDLEGAEYPFYDRMIEAGWGQRERLIENVLVGEKAIGGVPWFDVYAPGWGFVRGEWYVGQQAMWMGTKRKSASVGAPVMPPDQAVIHSTWLFRSPWVLQRAYRETVLELSS